ncbi:MAG TPA: hypothetical protein VMR97_07825 [Acidimicrobiales bacterium]|nr:hypothetical protein [Acidimicrobiales bacterium]
MTVKVNPRSIGVEGPFIPSDQAAERRMRRLLEELEKAGYGWRIVAGVRGWLEAKGNGYDPASGQTRTRYRKIIASLELSPAPKNGTRRNGSVVRALEQSLVEAGVERGRAKKAALSAASKPPIIDLM